jgi:hypothetical protein
MTQQTIQLNVSVPVTRTVDVLVVGGGPAGVAAAVTAARQGARVFLAEATSCLGGLGTAGLVPAFMQFTDGVRFLAGGIGREIYDHLAEQATAEAGNPCSIRVEALKRLYDRLLVQSDVDFLFESRLIAITKNGDRVDTAIFAGKTDLFAVAARVMVDATGDALLCYLAGAPCVKGDDEGNMMAGTLCSLWSGINWDQVKRPDSRELEQAFADGVFTTPDRHLPGMWRVGRTLGGGNIGHDFGVDGTDEASLTRSLVASRRVLQEYEQYYRQYLSGFADMELVCTAPMMGIRETRRIVGDYTLNLADFQNRAVFDDEIGRYAYPVDIHAAKPDLDSYNRFHQEHTSLRYRPGESYGIPYRCLIPQGLANVLTAGRCVSTDRYLQSSIRVMPGCYITGQAAGLAASLDSAGDVRAVDRPLLKERLADLGAIITTP